MTETLLAPQHVSPFKPGDRIIYQNRHLGTLLRVNHEYLDDHWFITWDDGTPTRLPVDESNFRWLTPEDERLDRAGIREFTQDIKEASDSAATYGEAPHTTEAHSRAARHLKDRGYRRVLEVTSKQTLNDLIDRALRRAGQLVAIDDLGQAWTFSQDDEDNRVITTPHPEYYDAVTVEHIRFPVRIIHDGMTR